MGIMDFVKGGVREMMIARPDQVKHYIVYKHPDQNVPFWSQLTVDSDECALFFKDGRYQGYLPPGRHTLSTQNIPFLNNIVNNFTGGNVFIAEIFFVKTQPVRGIPFGGPIGDLLDTMTGEQVCPRMFGEFALVVVDPVRFVIGYSGQCANGDNDQVLGWVKGVFFMGVKTVLGELSEQKSMLQTASLTNQLAQRFVASVPSLDEIGVRVHQMGNFTINFSDEDRKRLVAANAEVAKATRGVAIAAATAKAKQFELDQKFGQDARYVQQLAGNWQNYAAGSAVMGAGEGMAKGGGGAGVAGLGAQMAVGVGMGNMMAAQAQAQGPQFTPPHLQPQATPSNPTAAGGKIACPKCSAQVPPGKFCQECGATLAAPAKKFCTGCGQELGVAKFCANCGVPANAAP